MRARATVRVFGAALAGVLFASPFFACNQLTHIGDYQVDCNGCVTGTCKEAYTKCVLDPQCNAASVCFQQCAPTASIEVCSARCRADAGRTETVDNMLACIVGNCVPFCFGGNPGPPQDATTTDSAPTDASDGAPTSCGAGEQVDRSTCLSDRGPMQKLVAVTDDAGTTKTYCIDVTEVTFGAYKQFLADPSNVACGKSPECRWNTDFQYELGPADAASADTLPVYGIDWCDAYAYCQWAGKHLCGTFDGGTSPSTFAGVDAWTYACTNGTATAWPYANVYDKSACNTEGSGVLPVGSKATCVGKAGTDYHAIFDMSGNVAEWEDDCASDASDAAFTICKVRGGSFKSDASNSSCTFAEDVPRSAPRNDIGFRCCAP